MIRRPPRSTRTDTLFPDTTLFRSAVAMPAGHPVAGPAGLRARFELDASADLHLDTAGWGKGYAWVNGFFLGRYWRRGPQRTLYVPAPVTQVDENTLVIVELETLTRPVARFVAAPDLDRKSTRLNSSHSC